MDGLYFYWIVWCFWIIITFLMQKNKVRVYLAVWLLLILNVSNTEITILYIQVNVAIIVFVIGAMILLAQMSNWLTNIFRSFCLLFGYVGVLFWEQISPIWIVLPRNLMLSGIAVILLLVISKSFSERCAIWILGVTSGEIIHGLIMYGYGFQVTIGEMAFLDYFCIVILLLALIRMFKELKIKMDLFVQTVEKQKKRWTHE